jgi:hypothetical protein
MIQAIHNKYDHASYNELERLFYCAPKELEGVALSLLKKWKEMVGNFCTGCIEGALKEHPKYKLTKPLMSDVPGKINVADIMFVETNQDSKCPLYVQAQKLNVLMQFLQ